MPTTDDVCMRTTLTLDPDVAQKLQARVAEGQKSLKTVVNQALRLGLAAQEKLSSPEPFVVEPHPCGFRNGIDMDKMNQLVDELEAEEFLMKVHKKTC